MITINRKLLLDGLALLAPVVRAERVVPILTCVRVEANMGQLQLVGSSSDSTLTTTVPADGELAPVCVPFNLLHSAVKLFDGESVKVEVKANRVEVSCGKSRHKLPLHDATQFPLPDPVDGDVLLLSASGLATAIQQVSPCVDTKDGRYATKGVCLEAGGGELNVVAFDGVQMGVVRLTDTSATFRTTIIADALPALLKVLATVEGVAVTVGTNQLKFDCGDRQLTTRLLIGEFPAWRKVVPAESTHQVVIPPELATAVKRCSVTASEGSLVRRRLKLEFTSELLTVRSYDSDGESIEDVSIQCASLNGEPLVVKVNADQLLTYLQSAETTTLSLIDNKSALSFTEGNRRYLVMPLSPDK